jgi:hypothetical protein
MNCTILLSSSLFKHAATIPCRFCFQETFSLERQSSIDNAIRRDSSWISFKASIGDTSVRKGLCHLRSRTTPISNYIQHDSEEPPGGEKQRSRFKRGDFAFMISNGSVCIFIKDAVVQPMNPLGTILSGLELVDASAPGDVITIRKPSV